MATGKPLQALHVYCKDDVKSMLRALTKLSRRSRSAEVQHLIEQEYKRKVKSKSAERRI